MDFAIRDFPGHRGIVILAQKSQALIENPARFNRMVLESILYTNLVYIQFIQGNYLLLEWAEDFRVLKGNETSQKFLIIILL